MLAAAEEAGIDPAHVHAARELGYLVTDANRHLFSAMEVEAWREAVHRFRGDAEGHGTAEGGLDGVASSLELVVEETVLSEGDEQPALRFIEDLLNSLEDNENGAAAVPLVYGCLMSWLVGARDRGVDSTAAVTWVNDHLDEDAAAAALRASGFLGHPQGLSSPAPFLTTV